MLEKTRKPKKGASRKWAERLKEIGKRKPPQDLVFEINKDSEKEKVASSTQRERDLEI